MFSSPFKADRLRVNLQLVVNRLKLLEKKKTEQAQKARKEVADHLAAGKDERAGIRVEHIIREDYLVEAMEILELYCDLLLARFGLIQATKELDSGLAEAISTLIWAAPRLQSEVPELKIVSNQLCAKYSQEYGQLCRTNEIGTVSSRLMCKLSVNTLPQVLVEQYLIEIAKNYNVPYKSKATNMVESPADLISIGFTKDVKKGALGRGGGTVAGTGPTLWASPISVPGPLPVPSPAPSFSSLPPERQNASYKKNDLLSSLVPSPGLNPQTSLKPESRAKIGFDNFILPEVPDVKPQASLSIDPYDSEEVDFEDLDRRLEILKKTT
ncbi:IST1 homolog isoform X1 [Equus przewalskii]|nr:IST1 homolog isoform X1 [Equus caballus]XP_005608455.1 IST1 homolog isoform X1 [Equus caballus]XP_008519552.1 PREDICTED: IST1 homolog isoform X1 [Equus przewalskii]XP_008519553.1 PREDICTED: IST1 homolog isoform X1 [Equus przewalskii]XP_023493031.1 IST1 homolog isoform X1 [Equus caballus]XP_023493032.1 IST1 homolog isoform X1 [Equus caballus]XP_023493033.1 IST1 homolog isoform X1 [Equus caballus]XP_023493034.1 IST1 homolog isoform X1 [Equus caballus]XP_023493035.1 IST1 homolog isoform X1 